MAEGLWGRADEQDVRNIVAIRPVNLGIRVLDKNTLRHYNQITRWVI